MGNGIGEFSDVKIYGKEVPTEGRIGDLQGSFFRILGFGKISETLGALGDLFGTSGT